MLEFNTALEKDILVIELEGSLDSHSAADFRAWFNEKMRAGYRAFALDCLCLEYISSSGISALIDLQNALRGQQGKLVLFQLSSETRQLLRFLQLEKNLHLTADYDEAIAALNGIAKVANESAVAVTPDAMVTSDELKLAPQSEPKTSDALESPAASEQAMVVEERMDADKKGLHPLENSSVAAATTQATAQAAASTQVVEKSSSIAQAVPEQVDIPSLEPPSTERKPTPEAQEVRVNAAAKRLITCPNCKSVLRLAVAGDYLCPACRFRFTYKGSA